MLEASSGLSSSGVAIALAFLGLLSVCEAAIGQDAGGSPSTSVTTEIAVGTQATPARVMSDSGYVGARLAGDARIDIARARALALGARAGEVTSQMLQRHSGGSGLRFAFDIRSDGVTYEVGVDAADGTVLENQRVS